MSDVVQYGGSTVTMTEEELDARIAAGVKAAMLQQSLAAAGLARRTPEELLAEHDLPVTPEVAGLLAQVPEDRRDWLLRVGLARQTILRGRPVVEVATVFDHLNGHPTDPGSGQIGPALASIHAAA